MSEPRGPQCPVCHQAMELAFEVAGRGGRHAIYKCARCGITRLAPRPAAQA